MRVSSQFHSYTGNRGVGGYLSEIREQRSEIRDQERPAAAEIDRTEVGHRVILRCRIVIICKTGWGRVVRRAKHDEASRMAQNSILPWNAIIRGELSPPSPTPSSPVGGEMVLVTAPKPVWVPGFPGVPA